MKKIILFSLLVVFNSLLDSCATDDTFYFNVDLTAAGNFSMETYSNLNPGNGIAADEYAIVLEGNGSILTSQLRRSFGSELMADAAYALKDKVTNISITSNANLNDNYPAGSELKNLFAPLEIASHCMGNPGASNDCLYDYSSMGSLEQAFNEPMAVGFIERGGESGGVRVFALRTDEIIESRSHVFTVRFEFKGGKSTELITESVFFQ